MAETPAIQSAITSAEISAAAKAEAYNKNVIWAETIGTDSLIILESMMGNYETRNSNFRNELLKRDCLDTIKFSLDETEKTQVIANKNVASFLKKSVNTHLLQMIESSSAYETYKELVDMAPEKSAIVRAILGEVPNLSTHDMQVYFVEYQSIHSRLMKADPQGKTEASTQPAHLTRLLDGLSTE